ncbi:MAG: BON domain-containing protein [Deltaproteobacteria bacterium]|nr:BON domain-containing protein [Deltaproteobacteria bacterium]
MKTGMMKAGIFAGALMLALPLGAAAAGSDTDGTTAQGVRNEVRDIRNDAKQQVRDIRNDADRKIDDVRNDVRNSNLTQEERNKVTMDRLDAKEKRESMGEYFDDAGVTAKVKSKFIGQKGLDSLDIKVVTVDGTVTLMGDVNDASQIGLAENVAKEVEGVKAVDNKLVVKP